MEVISDLTLRPASRGDKEEWLALWNRYLVFYEADIPPAVTAETWERFLNSDELVGCVIAWNGDVAVGFATHVQHRSTWSTGDYLYLEDLFVDASSRGHGVGGKLIRFLYDLAARNQCSQVYWLTHETNANAMRLYDHIGGRSGFVHYKKNIESQ